MKWQTKIQVFFFINNFLIIIFILGICNTCGRSGHTANECYAKSKSNAPYNKQSSGYSQNQSFDKRRDYNRNDRGGSYDKFQNQNSRYGDNDRKPYNKGGRNDMNRSGGGNNGKLHCNNCNDDGHVYRDCPKKTKSSLIFFLSSN